MRGAPGKRVDPERSAGADLAPLGELDMRTSIRPTVARIDLGAIQANLRLLSRLVGDAGLLAVIKGDAYGHGAVAVARALSGRCAALAVSLVEEGLELRSAGIADPILVLGAYYDSCHGEVLDRNLTPVIYEARDLERFSAAAVAANFASASSSSAAPKPPADVHLKVDTGMSRLGIALRDLPGVLDRAAALPGIRIAGLCTHLASADAPTPGDTTAALARFRPCIDLVRSRGCGPLVIHAANSAAAVRFAEARFDAVRPGLALYGAMPSAVVAVAGLEPALCLSTRVMALRQVAAGTAVSYGGLWRAPRASLIGTLPVGYADGYPRHVVAAEVIVRGRRAPVVGAVCMDMMMIDLTEVPGAEAGDLATLIGADGGESIDVDELAGWAGTVSYEIMCGISKRVPRIYKGR